MMLCLWIGLFLGSAHVVDGLQRRRIPVTVISPEYIRLSSDPRTTKSENFVAKSKGVNICARRKERPKPKLELICEKNPWKCSGINSGEMIVFKKQYYTTYECCFGYERVKNYEGCPKDKFASRYNIIQVARKLGLTKFIYLAKKTLIHNILSKMKNVTIFIPNNEAIEKFLNSKQGKRTFNNNYVLRVFLAMHVFGGRWPTELIRNKQKLENILPGRFQDMNLKFFAKSMIIQNALVINANQPTSNGIVHVINDVLTLSRGSVRSIIKYHSNLTLFNEGLDIINYNLNGYNTIFAPSDDAFNKRGMNSPEDLTNRFKCIKEFIIGHIVRGLFFTAILKNKNYVYVQNHLSEDILIAKKNNKIYIKSRATIVEYIAASDGSVFIIDKLLISSKALSIQTVISRIKMVSAVADLVSKTRLEEEHLPRNKSLTLFLPSNRAMRSLSMSDKLKDDEEKINFLLNHIAHGIYYTNDLNNDLILNSLTNNSIHINKGSPLQICAQGSPVSYSFRNIPVCNAVLHAVTSQPIKESKYSLLDILNKDSRFSILSMALNITGMSKYIHTKSPLTLFAPTNEAWSKLDNKTLTNLFENNNKLGYIIKYHIIPRTIYSCYVKSVMSWRLAPYALTGSRVRISLKNAYSKTLLYNYARTIVSDVTAQNGVLHVIDQVVLYMFKQKYRG